MLVTFRCDAYENITMFGSVAIALIKLMGQSGHVPSAILAENVSDALAQLQRGLALQVPNQTRDIPEDTDEPLVSLSHRALPLIQLLQAAIKKKCDVLWA